MADTAAAKTKITNLFNILRNLMTRYQDNADVLNVLRTLHRELDTIEQDLK